MQVIEPGDGPPVLVTGCGGNVAQGVLKSLALCPGDVRPQRVIGCDMEPRSAGLAWCHGAWAVPRADDDGYVDALLRIADTDGARVVIPGSDAETVAVAAAAPRLRDAGITPIVGAEAAVRRAADKHACARRLGDAAPDGDGPRFRAPAGLVPSDDDRRWIRAEAGPEARADCESFLDPLGRGPWIVKARHGFGSDQVAQTSDAEEVRRLLARFPDPVVQECVGDAADERTAGILCDPAGDPLGRPCVMERELLRGTSHRVRMVPGAPEGDALLGAAAALAVAGPINLQYRLVDGEPWIFECNPRFSGTSPIRAHRGWNDVEMALRVFVHGEDVTPGECEPGVSVRWWDEVHLPAWPEPDADGRLDLRRGRDTT